jgi:hypothetical protein
LRHFITGYRTRPEGKLRLDVVSRFCLRRLQTIADKGPRGKAPSEKEIAAASFAAFNPSVFGGETLGSIMALQKDVYPDARVPIILPFLCDGLLALNGLGAEGIFRVSGDVDAVTEVRNWFFFSSYSLQSHSGLTVRCVKIKVRCDSGIYDLGGVEDPHVPASLLKLWLRELAEPAFPSRLYNECIDKSDDPVSVIGLVRRLPRLHRRVVVYVISFLQLFTAAEVVEITKMPVSSLALVFAPNFFRCQSDSLAVVFNNAKYEQAFVKNLLIHLRPQDIDPDFVPVHPSRGRCRGSPSLKGSDGAKSSSTPEPSGPGTPPSIFPLAPPIVADLFEDDDGGDLSAAVAAGARVDDGEDLDGPDNDTEFSRDTTGFGDGGGLQQPRSPKGSTRTARQAKSPKGHPTLV